MGITSYLFPKESVYGQSQADALNDDPELPDSVLNYVTYYVQTLQTDANIALQLGTQRIHPYTDLLLHDMGDALADGRPDFLATGNEWRTMPLWGIGLFEKTNGTPFYMHDGRARTIEEAILWHGGEAEKSKQQFMKLSKADRTQLISFLNTL